MGQSAWSIFATEYRNRKIVLRKYRTHWDVSPAHAYHAAVVVDATVGGPAVRRSGQTLPFLSDRPRFNARQSTLTAKGPAHVWLSHQTAQPHRLSVPEGELLPVPCPKEPVYRIIGFETKDHSLLFYYKVLKQNDYYFCKTRIKFKIPIIRPSQRRLGSSAAMLDACAYIWTPTFAGVNGG